MFRRFYQCEVEIKYKKQGEKEKTIEKTVKGEDVWFLGDEGDDLDMKATYEFLLITTRALP